MTRSSIAQRLDSGAIPLVAGVISLALGLFFMFVWAPHPWGWQGIDAYHELARALARGETFPTTDVPWGYAYYAALFYRIFGERLWAPLLGQVIANAFIPLLLYRLMVPIVDRRTAALASLITGIFSFNTVYASTQASDSICSVLFMCALVAFSAGWRRESVGAFALSGVLFGIVPQFRPNLVLLPAVLIGVYVLLRRFAPKAIGHAVVFMVLVAAVQLPWVVRNYRLTGLILPTSTHGGVQLWYGTLQVGPYLESRAANPRSYFESPAFDYASLRDATLIVDGDYSTCFERGGTVQLVYWTDRDPTRRRISQLERVMDTVRFAIPAQAMSTAVYYYFEESEAGRAFASPVEASANPWVVFVSNDHLGDLDTHDDVLDIFDIGRLMRYLAWQEPLRARDQLDLDRDGAITESDLAAAARAVAPAGTGIDSVLPLRFERLSDRARVTFGDGSHLEMPKQFAGRQSDFIADRGMAGAIVSLRRTFSSIAHPARRLVPGECSPIGYVAVNRVFYRAEPHMMQRYLALAYDNIERDPMAFAIASAYRAARLFVIRGSDDRNATQQFDDSRVAYGAGTLLSALYFAVFVSGVIVAARRRSALLLFLVPIIYVPVTICFVLTNMRYTVTVQPLMFAFMALAIVAALGWQPGGTSRPATRDSA